MRRLACSFAAVAAVVVVPSAADATINLQIVNQSGQPDTNVYVTMVGGGSYSFFTNNTPVQLSTVPKVGGTYQTTVDHVSARLYVAFGAGVNVSVPFDSKTRFDWAEFTVTPAGADVANLTRVDMFGIPLRLDTLDGSGNVLQTLSEANGNTIFNALQAIPGGSSAVVRDDNHNIVRILSPNKSSAYPSLAEYVKSFNGQTITLRGRFFGSTQSVWNYSGTFGPDGSITLAGTTNPPGQAPASIPINGPQLISDIYTGGNTPNTAQGAMYRDLLAGFATGLWGGKYGNSTLSFCTNPASDGLGSWCPSGFNQPGFGDARTALTSYAACEQYAAVINQLSDAYGNPYSDAAKPVLISLNQSSVATLRLTILPDTGSSQPVHPGNPNCGAAQASGGPSGPSGPAAGETGSTPTTSPSSSSATATTPSVPSSTDTLPATPLLPAAGSALAGGRTLLQTLNAPRSRRVRNPRSIVVGTAACPPVCGTVSSTATVAGAVVGRDRTAVETGETRRLTLALTSAGRRLLRHHVRLRTTLRVHVDGPGPADADATHRLTLKRA